MIANILSRFKFSMFALPFSHYLFRIFALLAVAFFASGVVSWIAANWSLFGKMEKLGLLEGLFGLSLLIGGICYHREISRKQLHFHSQLWLFLAAVLIGGLFALIGQIYQTGANAWQLFAIWALLQLPLLYALPNIANVLLWLVTSNTALALALLLQGESIVELCQMVALNVLLLFAIERFSPKFHDRKLISANLLFAWLLVLFVIGGFIEPSSRLIFWVLAAGLAWYFRRHFSFRILVFIYALVEGNIVILDNVHSEEAIVLASSLNLLATILVAIQVAQRHSNFGRFLLIFATLLFILSFLAFSFIIIGIHNETFLLILTLGLFITTLFIKHSILRDVVLIMSVLVGVIYAFIDSNLNEGIYHPISWGLIGLYAIGYWREKIFWLKVLLSLGLLSIFFIRFMPYLLGMNYWGNELSLWSHYIYLLLPLFCLLSFALYSQGKKKFYAFGWGVLLFLLIIGGIQAVNFNEFSANPETELHTLADFFHAITRNFFRAKELDPAWWLHLITSFSALWLVIWLVYQHRVQGIYAVALLIVAVLLSLGFIGTPIVGLLFSLLLIAHSLRNKTLWGICVVGLLIFLTLFYYNLTISLLFKSLLLMGLGAILGLLAFSIYRRPNQSETVTIKVKKGLFVSAFICLVATLSLANFSIWQFEDILQSGEKIVLKLAPRDPRSLMQGDYMELNYEILSELSNIELDNQEKQQKIYLHLYNQNGIDEFCGYSLEPQSQFKQCRENIYLPIKIQMGRTKMAGMDFFFAEGKREHFEQAEYGEFRFKNGKLLLLNLLDREQKIL